MSGLKIINQFLNKENVNDDLKQDLEFLKRVINQEEPIDRCRTEDLVEALKKIFEIHQNLDPSSREELGQSLRLFIFVLQRHKEKIVESENFFPSPDPLDSIVQSISNEIGFIPTELSELKLPEDQFLPQKFSREKEKWKKKPCPNPNRTASSQKDGKMFFLKNNKQDTTSVRMQLAEDAKKLKNSSVPVENTKGESENRYLNFTDLEYYPETLMHADHFLPVDAILRRLKEVVIAMNYDSTFKEYLSEQYPEFFSEYFIEQTTEGRQNIVGSYWYYLAHFNSMDNLWFLLASDNVGGGKQAMDPVEWLNQGLLGEEYLQSLRDENKYIDKSYTMYKIKTDPSLRATSIFDEGESLKDSFMKFVKKKYEKNIDIFKILAQTHQEMRSKIFEASKPDATTKPRSTTTIALLADMLSENIVKPKADESSDSSVDSKDFEEIKNNEKYIIEQEKFLSAVRAIRREVKEKKRKAVEMFFEPEKPPEVADNTSRNIKRKINKHEKSCSSSRDDSNHEDEHDDDDGGGLRYN